jgi:hypothetical protein
MNGHTHGDHSAITDPDKYLAASSENKFLPNSMKSLQMVKNAEGNGGQRLVSHYREDIDGDWMMID